MLLFIFVTGYDVQDRFSFLLLTPKTVRRRHLFHLSPRDGRQVCLDCLDMPCLTPNEEFFCVGIWVLYTLRRARFCFCLTHLLASFALYSFCILLFFHSIPTYVSLSLFPTVVQVTQIRGHIAGTPTTAPSPHQRSCLHFFLENTSALLTSSPTGVGTGTDKLC